MRKNFLVFISFGLALILSLSTLTSCAKPNVISNSTSPNNTQSTSSAPPGLRLPDIHNFLIIKYGSNGKQIWKNIEDLGEKDAYVPMNLDTSENSYILGSNYDAKYDSDGKQIYFNTFSDRNIRAYASVLDKQGNIYLTGYSNAGDQIVVFKYDNNGQQVWSANYRYPGNPVTMTSGITLDESGDIYVAGFTSPDKDVAESKLLLLKLDNLGNLLWSVKDNGLLKGNTTIGPAVDTSGNVYVTGFTLNTTGHSQTTNYDYVTVKYDTNGTKLWETYYNGPANGYDVPHDLKVDSSGNVIVTGESDGVRNIREVATINYYSDGKELWVSRYTGESGYGGTPSALVIDSKGNIYIAGRAFTQSGGDDYLTIKYDSNGRQLWDASYDGKGKGLNEASALFVDEKGNVYVTGQCRLDSQYVNYDTLNIIPTVADYGSRVTIKLFS